MVQSTTCKKVMSMRENDSRHKGVANTLTKDEVNTVCAVIDFFGGNVQQAVFDLTIPRYRVFDFLAMCVMGRINSDVSAKVLVYSFLKAEGDIDRWIQDLRETDYQIVTEWEELELTV